jgi:hypothetical protein
MKKSLVFLIVVLLALVFAAPASAEPIEPEVYEFVEIYCTYTIGTVWIEGDMFYNRDSVMTGLRFAVSEHDPIQIAIVTAGVNQNLNMRTGRGLAWGHFLSEPVGLDGTIEGNWMGKQVPITPEFWVFDPEKDARGVGFGTGELASWAIKGRYNNFLDLAEFAGVCPGGGDPLLGARGQISLYIR